MSLSQVIVKFVETAECCECITEEGKTLRDVHPAWLETVIPKVQPQIILIVRGKQQGQVRLACTMFITKLILNDIGQKYLLIYLQH